MHFQGILNLFPYKLCMAGLTTIIFHMNFMTNIIHTTEFILNRQADHINTRFVIRMEWIFSIAKMAIAKIPLIRNDIMLAGGIVEEMDLVRISYLLPFKSCITFRGYTLYMDFMTYIIYATGFIFNY